MTTGNISAVFRTAQGIGQCGGHQAWINWLHEAQHCIAFCCINIRKHVTTSSPSSHSHLLAQAQACIILHQGVILKNPSMYIIPGWPLWHWQPGGKSCRQTKPKWERMCEAKECVLTADCTTKDSVKNSGQTAETNTLADKHTELKRISKQNVKGLTGKTKMPHD